MLDFSVTFEANVHDGKVSGICPGVNPSPIHHGYKVQHDEMSVGSKIRNSNIRLQFTAIAL